MKIRLGTVIFSIIGVLFVLYGIAVMLVRSGSRFYLVWYVLGALLFLSAYICQKRYWAGFPAALKIIIIIFISAALFWIILTQILVVSAFNKKAEGGLDYLIVLGSQVTESGPAPVTKFRLDAAFDYLQENNETKVIVSGGAGKNELRTEAEVMRDYLIERGIKKERIITEDGSRNTTENINLSSRFLDRENDTVGIVTNNFHIFRATAIARKAGYKHVSGIAAWSVPFYLPNNCLRESVGIMKDLLLGNM